MLTKGEAMKRCAVCGEQYQDDYDACPHCAKARTARGCVWRIIGAIVTALALMAVLVLMAMCSAG